MCITPTLLRKSCPHSFLSALLHPLLRGLVSAIQTRSIDQPKEAWMRRAHNPCWESRRPRWQQDWKLVAPVATTLFIRSLTLSGVAMAVQWRERGPGQEDGGSSLPPPEPWNREARGAKRWEENREEVVGDALIWAWGKRAFHKADGGSATWKEGHFNTPKTYIKLKSVLAFSSFSNFIW